MMENDEPIIERVGTFFYVMGGGIFLLFVVSDLADKADFDYLFTAVLLISIGWILRRNKPPPPSAGRFAWFNKKREEARQKRKARQDARKK